MKKSGLIFLGALSLSAMLNAQNIGLNLAYIDSSYSPRSDFYNFCNGKWLRTTQIPASDSRYGSFNEINDRNLDNLKNILTSTAADTKALPGSDAQKLRDFYLTAMDSVKADKDGINPIKPQLAEIEAMKTHDDVVKMAATLGKLGISTPIGFGVDVDMKNSKRYLVYFGQNGFSLPDRDYYYLPQYEAVRAAYIPHIKNMLELLGLNAASAQADADKVFGMEKALALKAMNAEEQRDIQKQYNPYSKAGLKALTPNINWDLFFANSGLKEPDSMIVAHVDFYKDLNTLIKTYPVSDWKLFYKWKLIHRAAPFLSSKMEAEDFAFFSKTLQGAKQMKPRWKRSQSSANAAIGEILGKFYVEKYFNNDAKEKVKKMVDNLIVAYRERLATRTWMSDATKKQANLKLDLLVKKFGFPDTWRDYSTLTIGRESYWKNVAAASGFEFRRGLGKLGKPVDRMEWGMTPPTVNAYYNPTTNEITFPAGIMQVPFFNFSADDAFNYGIMGAIIGHELTHGFDDQGSQFDADGNLKMWWTEEDYKNFKEKTKLVINQFNGYVAVDTLHVNGSLTQGENIADLGGLTMAYYAYKKSLNGQKSPVISGFTGEQRFFMAWTQGWKGLSRDAAAKQLLATDPHAPARFRGFGPLTNMKEFYDAFGVKPGDAMYRGDDVRAEIW